MVHGKDGWRECFTCKYWVYFLLGVLIRSLLKKRILEASQLNPLGCERSS